MKSEYKPWRSVMLDVMGRFRTTSLFWEWRGNNDKADKYPPLFTTKPVDHTVNGITYRSLKAVYFSYDHVPELEYEFAMDVFGSWDHWVYLSTKSQLKHDISNWRLELEIRIKAEAMRTMLLQAKDTEKGLSAARMIIGDEHKGSKRGRPSKEEVARNTKIAAGVRDTLQDDMERLGISLVKNG